MSQEFDVFVSHNQVQKAWVRQAVKQWRNLGLKVFFDEENIEPGEDIVTGIERGLHGSKHVVLVISPSALKSRWVAMEVSGAIFSDPDASKRRLIPIMIEPVDIGIIRISVRKLNIIDLTRPADRDSRYHALLRFLAPRCDRYPAPPAWEAVETTSRGNDTITRKPKAATQLAPEASVRSQQRIDIVMEQDFNRYSPEQRARILKSLGRFVGDDEIKINRVHHGGISFSVSLPQDQALKIVNAVKMGRFRDIGIRDANPVYASPMDLVSRSGSPPEKDQAVDRRLLISKLHEMAHQLAPLLGDLQRLLRMIDDPNTTKSEIARVIRLDPILSKNLCDRVRKADIAAQPAKRINTIFVPAPAKKSTKSKEKGTGQIWDDLNYAINLLSIADIRAEVVRHLGKAILDDPQEYHFHGREYWIHSAIVGNLAIELFSLLTPDGREKIKSIADADDATIANRLYMIGFFHDIGKVMLAQIFFKSSNWIANYFSRALGPLEEPSWKTEKRQIGVDHAMAGKILFDEWPPVYGHAIGSHHDYEVNRADCDNLTKLIHFSNKLVPSNLIRYNESGTVATLHLPIDLDVWQECQTALAVNDSDLCCAISRLKGTVQTEIKLFHKYMLQQTGPNVIVMLDPPSSTDLHCHKLRSALFKYAGRNISDDYASQIVFLRDLSERLVRELADKYDRYGSCVNSDVIAYSRLVALGKPEVRRALEAYRDNYRRIMEQLAGRYVNAWGDEYNYFFDVPGNAVRSIIFLLSAVKNIVAPQVRDAAGEEFRLKVGIATGQILAFDVQGSAGEVTIDTINVAGHLQKGLKTIQPGHPLDSLVAVCPETYHACDTDIQSLFQGPRTMPEYGIEYYLMTSAGLTPQNLMNLGV